MKHTTALLSLLLLVGSSGTAISQITKPKTAKPIAKASSEYCTMKDGKMMMMKGGKMMPMSKNMTMSDGTKCMTDGTCKMKDGTTMNMKEGQCMMMNGKMTMHPGEHMGHKMHDMKM